MGPTPSSRGFEAPFEVFRRLNSSCFIDPYQTALHSLLDL